MSKKTSQKHGDSIDKETDQLTIDYPQEEETLIASYYAFRIKTPSKVNGVEVSINGEDWRTCREALGLWWFDWQGYEAGNYEIVARAQSENGKTLTSPSRHFSVSSREN